MTLTKCSQPNLCGCFDVGLDASFLNIDCLAGSFFLLDLFTALWIRLILLAKNVNICVLHARMCG